MPGDTNTLGLYSSHKAVRYQDVVVDYHSLKMSCGYIQNIVHSTSTKARGLPSRAARSAECSVKGKTQHTCLPEFQVRQQHAYGPCLPLVPPLACTQSDMGSQHGPGPRPIASASGEVTRGHVGPHATVGREARHAGVGELEVRDGDDTADGRRRFSLVVLEAGAHLVGCGDCRDVGCVCVRDSLGAAYRAIAFGRFGSCVLARMNSELWVVGCSGLKIIARV